MDNTRTPRLPRIKQVTFQRAQTINGLPGTWSDTYPVAPLSNATVFNVKEGTFQGGPHKGEPFLNIQIGWSFFYREDGKRCRRPLQLFVRAPQYIEQVLDMELRRGDRINAYVSRVRVIDGREFEDGHSTVAFASAELFSLDGKAGVQVVGHSEIAEAAVFDNTLAEDPNTSASDEPLSIDSSSEYGQRAA